MCFGGQNKRVDAHQEGEGMLMRSQSALPPPPGLWSGRRLLVLTPVLPRSGDKFAFRLYISSQYNTNYRKNRKKTRYDQKYVCDKKLTGSPNGDTRFKTPCVQQKICQKEVMNVMAKLWKGPKPVCSNII